MKLVNLFRRLCPRPVRRLVPAWLRRRLAPPDPTLADPTTWAPPGYNRTRSDAVYGDAFYRFFEYLSGTRVHGDVLEFGTLHGYTARILATLIQVFGFPGNLYLYDSFDGLPDIESPVDQHSYEVSVNQVWTPGAMAVGGQQMADHIKRALSTILPAPRLKVVRGYFEDTLETQLPQTKVALVHLDCDLYSSAKCVLDHLLEKDLLQDGCLLVCDDYNCNRANPLMGERRALAEAFDDQDRFDISPFFSYGWHGMAFFVHDLSVAPPIKPSHAGKRTSSMILRRAGVP
jgi:hypothetical protein